MQPKKPKLTPLVAISPGWAVHPTANVQNEIEIDCDIPAYSKQGHVSDLVRQGDTNLFKGDTIGWRWGHTFGVEERREFAYLSNLMLFNGTGSSAGSSIQTKRIRIEGRHVGDIHVFHGPVHAAARSHIEPTVSHAEGFAPISEEVLSLPRRVAAAIHVTASSGARHGRQG